ncbi:MAG: hypothetical protein A2X58_01170 [Nitrospirae bacterium GWC2_56_14]|nr:MAG: hypothetical protein A2X58_01170 [Nitrospirae bacterium GWC2_56_14]
MKNIIVLVCGVLFALVVMALPGSVWAEQDNSINIGGLGLVGPDLSASAFIVEYERHMGSGMSVFGRVGVLDYSFDDGWYKEDGDGPGFDIGIRKYMGSNGMKGFYLGGTVGIWTTEWTFTDNDYGTGSIYYRGKGDTTSLKVDIEVGGRFPLGSSPVSLMPSLHVGNFFNIDSTCTSTSVPGADCGNESEVGFYGLLGLSMGIAF